MRIYIKVGTMPAIYMHVCNKINPPKIGDYIYLKEINRREYKKERVYIDDISEMGNEKLYFAARI